MSGEGGEFGGVDPRAWVQGGDASFLVLRAPFGCPTQISRLGRGGGEVSKEIGYVEETIYI